MKIDAAEYKDGRLHLTVPANEGLVWLNGFKAGKDYEIKRKSARRSNNANAYAWELIGQLSEALRLPRLEIYRNAIKNISGVTDILEIPHGAADRFKRTFTDGHMGRDVEIIAEGERDTVLVTYGSSDYNSREMAALIDSLTADCRELGIETLEDIKIKSLLEAL